jgi:site-specific recombinase XerD
MASTGLVVREDDWKIVTDLVLGGISSHHTRRAYSQALDEFLIWFRDEPGRQFNKATVQKYRTELETKGLAPSSINVRLSAIRRLALEASDNGQLDPEIAAGIARAKGAKRSGVRLGHWLTAEQAQTLLDAPDLTTLKGLRDRAILAVLLGAGLRRSELADLNVSHVQQRDGRWLLADLVGKHGRIRSIPIPAWANAALVRWRAAAGIDVGPLCRRVTKYGTVAPWRISPQAVFAIMKLYAAPIGVHVGPHDARRYAECRIMPNRHGHSHARKGLDSARCGIVLTIPVLRAGRRTPSDWTAPFQE